MTNQNKTHGVLTDAEIRSIYNDPKISMSNYIGYARDIEAAVLAKAAPQSPVAPAKPRCSYCDGTGDVHTPDGEWRGACPECKPVAPADERAAFESELLKRIPNAILKLREADDEYRPGEYEHATHEFAWGMWQARARLADAPTVSATANEHIDDDAVDRFAEALKEKLAQARKKGRSGWHECNPRDLSTMLREHVEKGDPRDVANFCMFLWSLGQPISAAPTPPTSAADAVMVPTYVVNALKAWTGSEPSVSVLARAVDQWLDPTAVWEHDRPDDLVENKGTT